MKPQLRRGISQIALVFALVIGLGVVGWVFQSVSRTAAATSSLDGSEKLASAAEVSPGAEFTYMIVLSNSTASSVGPITVTDALPSQVDYVEGSIYTVPGGKALWDAGADEVQFRVPSVGAQSVITLGFLVELDPGTPADTVITNTAMISDGLVTLARDAVVTVGAPPFAQIVSPWPNQLIDEQGDFVIRGRAWTAEQTPEFPDPPVLSEVVPGGEIARNWYYVIWSEVTAAQDYILEEATSPDFSDAQALPATSDTSMRRDNRSVGTTYYYRVKAVNPYEESVWSNVVSVTVTSGTALATTQGELGALDVVDYQPDVEINVRRVGESGSWQPVDAVVASNLGDWWDWSYTWDVQPEDDESVQYVIAVRAKDLGDNFDPDQGDVVTVTVANRITYVYLPIIAKRWPPVPYPPTLAKTGDDGAGNYTLTWSYDHSQFVPTQYQFQEATDAAFTTLTIDETRSSPQVFSGKPNGTYYYRVAGINAYGRGEWSNVVSVTVVAGFFDNFSDTSSGWPRAVYRVDDKEVFDATYDNGAYRAKILKATSENGYITNKRMGSVAAPWTPPSNSYEVSVKHYFTRAGDQSVEPTAGKAGLIFGANADFTNIYVIEWNFEGRCSINQYYDRSAPVSRADIPRDIRMDWGSCPAKAGYDQVNEARVVVNGSTARVYMNGELLREFSDNDLSSLNHVGLLTGAWQRTPVDSRFDDFSVK